MADEVKGRLADYAAELNAAMCQHPDVWRNQGESAADYARRIRAMDKTGLPRILVEALEDWCRNRGL